jgi:adenine-specific DNA-methyltransferase
MRYLNPDMANAKRQAAGRFEVLRRPKTRGGGVVVTSDANVFSRQRLDYALYNGRCEDLLATLPENPLFDRVVTSPPYNIGKPYEQKVELQEYRKTQKAVIVEIVKRLKPTGSLCWQVGNYVVSSSNNRGSIYPLDHLFHPLFDELGLVLRNRIVWRFGHGLHCKHRFSGRYEVILWYTHPSEYYFDLDAVRVRPKYPGKRHYKGPKIGKLSSNPNGKNPDDVWEEQCDRMAEGWENPWEGFWDIPNVKSNHVEKHAHPCQFPVGLVERLVKALCPVGGLVFDPYAGVASAGVAAAANKRRFWGAELAPEYARIGQQWINDAIAGKAKYRPHDKPIYDHTQSPLSRLPLEVTSLFKLEKD